MAMIATTVEAPKAGPSGFIQWFASLGHEATDTAELKRQKSLLLVVTVLKASICAGWYLPLYLLGAKLAAAAPFLYQISTVVSVWLFARTKSLAAFRARQISLILLLPLGVHLGLGGFSASGGVLVWCFLAPLLSLLFEGPRQSLRWFLAFVAVVLLAGTVEIFHLLPAFALPWWMKLAFFVMNLIAVTGIVYAGVRYFAHLLEQEKALHVSLYHELQQANQHKSKFLAGMSHELRTPLNAIIGFTRIVKRKGKKDLPEKQLDNLDKVLDSAHHLLSLINDVLDLVKLEAGQVELEYETFSVAASLQRVCKNSQQLVAEGVGLELEIEEQLPPVYSDRGKVEQIISHLVSNAAKFTDQGEIRIAARCAPGGIAIAVEDTGIGIPEASLEKIFGEFHQASASSHRLYGGAGLGLSISQGLSRMLGASLSAESREGLGSTFTLHLPQFQRPAPPRPATPVTGCGPVLGALELLAIDDDPDALYLLRENLDGTAYQVISATSGSEGLRLAKERKPFAITLDVMMPERDGWQTLHELKRDPETRDIPVIMLSIVDNRQLGYQLGAADFLLKPLDGPLMRKALERLLPQRVLG